MNSPQKLIRIPGLSDKTLILVMLLGAFITMLSRVEVTVPVLYYLACLIGAIILFAPCFLPAKLVIFPFLVLIVNMADLTQSSEQVAAVGSISAATPWQFFLGPITPAVFVFLSLFITLFRILLVRDFKKYIIFFFFFFVLATATSVLFRFMQDSFVRFIIDAKIPMFFCTGILLFASYFNRFPERLYLVAQVFFGLAAGNFLIDLLKLFSGQAGLDDVIGYRNLSLDSGKGLLTLFFFYFLAKTMEGRRVILNLIFLALTVYLLISYQTRWLLITLVGGLLVVSVFLGFRRFIKVAIPAFLFLSLAIPIAVRLEPEAWKVMLLRFSFLEQLNSGSAFEDVDLARAGSIYNSLNLLKEKNALFTGLGYGSWFTDSFFPMPDLTTAAFDEASLDAGKYYRVHDFTFHFLFKFGVIGLIVYLSIFIRPLRKLWKIKSRLKLSRMSNMVAVVLLGIGPMVITNMWFTGKGLLFSALYVVFVYEWIRLANLIPGPQPFIFPIKKTDET